MNCSTKQCLYYLIAYFEIEKENIENHSSLPPNPNPKGYKTLLKNMGEGHHQTHQSLILLSILLTELEEEQIS